jgi:hypothetical protein
MKTIRLRTIFPLALFVLVAGCSSSAPEVGSEQASAVTPSLSSTPASNSAPQKEPGSAKETEPTTPDGVWNAMKAKLLSGKIDEAARHFSLSTSEDYRKTFAAMESKEIAATMNKTIKKAVIKEHTAQYYFEDKIGGTTFTFPVEFVKENGVWKILEF